MYICTYFMCSDVSIGHKILRMEVVYTNYTLTCTCIIGIMFDIRRGYNMTD